MKKLIIPFVIVSFGMASCNPEINCGNLNPVFDTKDYKSEEYKSALSSVMTRDAGSVRFFLKDYKEHDGQAYILVLAKEPEVFCAKAWVLLNDNKAFLGIRKAKGASYHGAELKGLQLVSRLQADTICYVVKDIDWIFD